MASLTIRNVTIHPLELKTVERFDGFSPKNTAGVFVRLCRILTGFFIGASSPAIDTPQEGLVPYDTRHLNAILTGPFETKATSVRAPDTGNEVTRLTFQTPGTTYRYIVDLPSPNARSQVFRKLDGAPLDLTAIYAPSGAQLTIFASAVLEAWMRELRDEYPLSMLSIPGTHNSPTCFVALPSVRCQAVGVREQLDNGVRFLDVRVSANRNNDDLALVHSVFPIALTGARHFAQLLGELYAFLDANPSETLLLSVKREGTGRGTDQQLSQHLFKRYCGGEHVSRWFTEPRIPSLGEVRGKIVLIRRFHADEALLDNYDGKGWGIDASTWPDNCADGTTGSGLIRVQDFYEVTQSTNIEKKIDYARAHLERACQQTLTEAGDHEVVGFMPTPGPQPLPLFVNFLSASNFFNASCWPEKIAAKVNPSITEHLCIRHAEKGKSPADLDVGDAGTGIVVTDWVGLDGDWDLIRCVVGWNTRLQFKT